MKKSKVFKKIFGLLAMLGVFMMVSAPYASASGSTYRTAYFSNGCKMTGGHTQGPSNDFSIVTSVDKNNKCGKIKAWATFRSKYGSTYTRSTGYLNRGSVTIMETGSSYIKHSNHNVEIAPGVRKGFRVY